MLLSRVPLRLTPRILMMTRTNGHAAAAAGGFVDAKTTMRAVQSDFRSDTLTAPPDDVFDAMKEASRGDDVYGEDSTTIRFQQRIAKMTGKEDALFCVSGTMTNQLAIRTWLTQPPHSVLCDARSHIHNYEAGGIAFHSQATAIPVSPSNGHTLTLQDMIPLLVTDEDIHFAPTRLVCLENTIKGLIQPQKEIVKISDHIHYLGMKMHLDGARLWEVSAKTVKSIKELCDPFDSVSLCLSKGIGAPIGSILVGPSTFIRKARGFRKLFGGASRQCGSIVAAASYCLDRNFSLLPLTHAKATYLANSLHQLGVKIIMPVETNHVFIDPSSCGIDIDKLCHRAEERGIRLRGARLLIHVQITDEAIESLITLVKEMKQEHDEENGDDGWQDESASNAAGQLYKGLAKGTVQIASRGVPYAGN